MQAPVWPLYREEILLQEGVLCGEILGPLISLDLLSLFKTALKYFTQLSQQVIYSYLINKLMIRIEFIKKKFLKPRKIIFSDTNFLLYTLY